MVMLRRLKGLKRHNKATIDPLDVILPAIVVAGEKKKRRRLREDLVSRQSLERPSLVSALAVRIPGPENL